MCHITIEISAGIQIPITIFLPLCAIINLLFKLYVERCIMGSPQDIIKH
jgi:hypothetical protein